MTFTALAALVTLATIPPVHAIAWAVIRVWRRWSDRCGADRADAGAIFLATVTPAVLAVCAAVLVTLPAFLLFEPPARTEQPGVLLAVSAAAGVAYVLTALGRALEVQRLSRRCLAAWMPGASPLSREEWGLPAYAIDADYPVVAVAGVIRPRLLIDRRVLRSCSHEELRAVAGHELAHVTNHDNARRVLIAACVGSRSAPAKQWRDAAEMAADERAADDPDRAAILAGALIKIARLATAAPRSPLPFAAIYESAALEMRVHRLLASTPLRARTTWPTSAVAAVVILSAAMATQGPQVLFAVHAAIEVLVRSH